MVGITAAEAEDPRNSIPKATNQVVYRILIFLYWLTDGASVSFPVEQCRRRGSPFVMIFDALDSPWVATALNVVVLTAALSVYNSGVYCNSRMLLGWHHRGMRLSC